MSQLDTADLQPPSEAFASQTTRLKEKLARLTEEMQRLKGLEARMLAAPDQQISLTDPDFPVDGDERTRLRRRRLQRAVAVDTQHHLIVTHEVTNVGNDRAQLARVAKEAKATLQTDTLDAVADRAYFSGEEILACDQAGITVTLPKPMTSGIEPKGRFGKQDFVYLPEEDVYRYPAGERLKYYYSNVENGLRLCPLMDACRTCALKSHCTTGVLHRITRWEHEHVLEAVQVPPPGGEGYKRCRFPPPAGRGRVGARSAYVL